MRAFGFSVGMRNLMAPNVATFQSNPLLAPYAGLLNQAALNMPYMIARDEYRDQREARAAQERQLAQQAEAQQRAYELELMKQRAKQQATADATDEATALLGGG